LTSCNRVATQRDPLIQSGPGKTFEKETKHGCIQKELLAQECEEERVKEGLTQEILEEGRQQGSPPGKEGRFQEVLQKDFKESFEEGTGQESSSPARKGGAKKSSKAARKTSKRPAPAKKATAARRPAPKKAAKRAAPARKPAPKKSVISRVVEQVKERASSFGNTVQSVFPGTSSTPAPAPAPASTPTSTPSTTGGTGNEGGGSMPSM
jgi:hypothetical protein